MGRAHEVRAASMAKTAAAKSKLNNKYSRTIYMAAKSGIPDPELNLALKHEIEKAKREQVNADTIKRAIEKAKGGSTENYYPIRYEGFGPNNSMLIIECITDNENRTLTAVKTALNKCGAKLGVAGCVRHMFDYYAVFTFQGMNDEEAFEAVAEFDVADVFSEDGYTTVYANSSDYQGIRDALLAAKPDLTFVEDVVTYVPQNTVTLTDQKEIDQFNRLRTMLDDIDDVQDLFHNIVGLDDEE
jgi:YebC/PmpR family DNA-binding regulatory protein